MLKLNEKREIIARLVGGAVNTLDQTTQNPDPDFRACCPVCCSQCSALKQLHDVGALDKWYAIYVELTGTDDLWDAENKQIDREWLAAAWPGNRGCHRG